MSTDEKYCIFIIQLVFGAIAIEYWGRFYHHYWMG